MFDLRTWALHDAVFQLARESGLETFRVECKVGPAGETVISLVLASERKDGPRLAHPGESSGTEGPK